MVLNMSKYTLENGYVLSDEEIEKGAAQWEDDTWDGNLVALRVGRPKLSVDKNEQSTRI